MEMLSFVSYFFIGTFIFILLAMLFSSFFVVEQQKTVVIERLGKFNRTVSPGLHMKIPLIEKIKGILNLRIQQLDVKVETKTKDNVFITATVSVQYHVLESKIYEAYYRLSDADKQIQSFVFDVVRAQVPKMDLDQVFENKDEVANAVKTELTDLMSGFGYGILKALVTDIDPDKRVKSAMNEINEQKRLRMAAQEKGEAEKILKVKKAEGEAESMRLNGKGIADQRKAIVDGLRESIDLFHQGIPGSTPKDIMQLVLAVQYYDTLKEIGANNKSSTILIPSQATDVNIGTMLRDSVITGNLAVGNNRQAQFNEQLNS